jgi:hypothetical protein
MAACRAVPGASFILAADHGLAATFTPRLTPRCRGQGYGGVETKLPAENDDARADEFCAPTENSTRFEIFDNNREAKSIVQRLSNPMMLFRNITEVNCAMVVGHGVITFRIGVLADEFKCLARAKVFIGITAAINSSGRFMV